jgi:hypothetical protein
MNDQTRKGITKIDVDSKTTIDRAKARQTTAKEE